MSKTQRQQMISKNDGKFKNFWDIYKLHCVFMKLGLIWPNGKGDGLRRTLIGVNTILAIPCFVIIGNDARRRILSSDVPNLIRQLIVIIAVLNVKIKMFLSIIQAKQLKEVINTINDDYIHFNTLPEEYRELVEKTIRQTKICLYIWTVVIGGTTLSFPTLAAAFTVYSQLFSDTPRKYMVHECWLILVDEEHQLSAPYYHCFAGYSTCIILMVFVGFIAYDGLFILTILHVTLRLRIISLNLLHLARGAPSVDELKRRIKEFVRGHCECQRFIAKVERCFQWWLIMLFFNAILQIVMSLSQTTKKNDSDYKLMYHLLFTAIAIHTHLLCHLISQVTQCAEDIANVAYNTSWEVIRDSSVRKSLALIMTRAQVPTYFKAMGMLTINMQLFVKILQTSYSIFTILRK